MTKFWKVAKAEGADSANSTRYPTREAAMEVAEGLCRRYRVEYVVLESVAYCAIPDQPLAWHFFDPVRR